MIDRFLTALKALAVFALCVPALTFATGGETAAPAEPASAQPSAQPASVQPSSVPPASAQPASIQPASGAPATPQPSVAEPTYQIGPEDVLEISVWKEDGLRREVLVRPDGGISFPLVGEISALGKTAGQLEAEITEKLDRFIPQPAVSVAVLKVTGNKFYVIGKVQRPGEFVAGRYVDVLQALSMAGGLTPFAAENKIKVLRKEDGKDTVWPFQYSKIRKGENLEQNIVLKNGDVVVVP